MEMREVASQSFAPVIVRRTRNTAEAVCPMCHRDIFHYDFELNVAACPACCWGGGVLDTWALFKGFQGPDARKKAAKDIASGSAEPVKTLPPVVKESKMANIKKRHNVNSYVLSKLTLSEEHRKMLRNRGLNNEDIDELGYKDNPTSPITLNKDGSGVPGTYIEARYQSWVFTKLKPGILIPERNSLGMIQGFQTSPDDRKPKYYTVTSDKKKGGTKASTFVHFVNRFNSDINTIVLTEGPLKADVINAYTGQPVLAIPGVSSQKNLEAALLELKKKGLQEIEIAFDMDFYTKETVQKAFGRLKKKLTDLELEFVQLKWNTAYKGYDDYLLYKHGGR